MLGNTLIGAVISENDFQWFSNYLDGGIRKEKGKKGRVIFGKIYVDTRK